MSKRDNWYRVLETFDSAKRALENMYKDNGHEFAFALDALHKLQQEVDRDYLAMTERIGYKDMIK